MQIDGHWFPDAEDGNNEVFVRRLRPVFEGKAGLIDWRFMPELAGTVRILDAWGDLRFGENHYLRVGKFKGVIGLERQQSFSQRLFIEPGMPWILTPTREIGGEFHGTEWRGVLDWTVGIYNGTLDNCDLSINANFSSNFDLGARVALRPWIADDGSPLQGLTVGFAASQGEEDTVINDADRDRRIRYVTAGRNTYFRYTDGVEVNGTRQRINPFISYYHGPFGLLTEYVQSRYDFSRGGVSQTIDTDAWTIQSSWVITGENASFKGVRPKVSFAPASGTWGAFEVGLRYTFLEVGDGAFMGDETTRLARDGTSQKADSYGIALNWYLSANLLIALNYQITEFSGLGDYRPNEDVILTRFQIDF
jgi:phosphate-selective porin OprO/OprP